MADEDRFKEAFKVACEAAKEDGLTGRSERHVGASPCLAWLAGPGFLDARGTPLWSFG